MDDTACGAECPLVKSGICQSDKQCPNFLETWWQEGEQGRPKMVRDCAPKRTMLQQADFTHRMIGMQAAIEQMRNKLDNLCAIFNQVAEQSQHYLDMKKNAGKIGISLEDTETIDI